MKGKGKIQPQDGKQFSTEYQPKEKWTEQKALDLGNELIQWLRAEGNKDSRNIFFVEFLVIEKNLYPQLIDYLTDKFTSFSYLIQKAKKIQEIKLLKHGITSELNATMTKFVLTNNHNYSEKVKEEHKHVEQPLFVFPDEID